MRPQHSGELLVLSLVALVSCVVAMKIAASVFGFTVASPGRVATTCAVSAALLLAIVAALRAYCLTDAGDSVRLWVQIGVAIVVILAAIVPLMCFVMKGNYVSGLLALGSSLIATALVVLVVRSAWHSVATSRESLSKPRGVRDGIVDEYGK